MASDSRSNRAALILAAVIPVAAIVAFALLQQTPPAPAPLPIAVASPSPTPFSTTIPGATSTTADASPSPTGMDISGVAPAWEGTIDQILRSNASESDMAQMLINVLPTLPEDGQIEAANHIANLLPDANYSSVRPLLLNASLPESVLSVFFTDLMNRDDPTKLNAFLDIAQLPNHPFHDEALSDLQIYVGDDYGTDWGKWKSAVSQYLKTANEQ
jgi:hypothetical protein